MDPDLLLAALEARREELGALRGGEPLPWIDVAEQVGTHSATFSRIKSGRLPGPETTRRLMVWLGGAQPEDFIAEDAESEEFADLECGDCGEHAAEGEELAAEEADQDDGDDQAETETETAENDPEGVAAIFGTGSLSDSDDPDTVSAVTRVRELLAEGAVGVSLLTDLNPEDLPDPDLVRELEEAEDWDALEQLFGDVQTRPRHVAIVDVPAFSDARLALTGDGLEVEGILGFEGIWTGDMRMVPYHSLVWDDELLPIPIIWDREDGDHTGQVVGYISTLERREGVTASARVVLGTESVDAVAAAAGGSGIPAVYFDRPKIEATTPLTISTPDARGLRHIYGLVAPRGVCHRSDMGACFQYPGDVDAALRGFHTGPVFTLDNGEQIRVGALTMQSAHLDTSLAARGVSAAEANRHREDSSTVLAMVRAWDGPYGLEVSGVVMPDIDESLLMRALACAPSVELWPSGRGRTLVGIHMVPTPAWPVAASAGEAVRFTAPTQAVELESEPVEEVAAAPSLLRSLERIEKALALLVADKIADVPLPEPGDAEAEGGDE